MTGATRATRDALCGLCYAFLLCGVSAAAAPATNSTSTGSPSSIPAANSTNSTANATLAPTESPTASPTASPTVGPTVDPCTIYSRVFKDLETSRAGTNTCLNTGLLGSMIEMGKKNDKNCEIGNSSISQLTASPTTALPTNMPTAVPTIVPTNAPSNATSAPSNMSTAVPTIARTGAPSNATRRLLSVVEDCKVLGQGCACTLSDFETINGMIKRNRKKQKPFYITWSFVGATRSNNLISSDLTVWVYGKVISLIYPATGAAVVNGTRRRHAGSDYITADVSLSTPTGCKTGPDTANVTASSNDTTLPKCAELIAEVTLYGGSPDTKPFQEHLQQSMTMLPLFHLTTSKFVVAADSVKLSQQDPFAAPTAAPTAAPAKSKSGHTVLIVVIVSILLASVGVIIVVCLRKRRVAFSTPSDAGIDL